MANLGVCEADPLDHGLFVGESFAIFLIKHRSRGVMSPTWRWPVKGNPPEEPKRCEKKVGVMSPIWRWPVKGNPPEEPKRSEKKERRPMLVFVV